MDWQLTHQADSRGCKMADRHYSRSRPGTAMFCPPGRMVVLITPEANALWVSSWPQAELLQRKWCPNAWMCTLFRNESEGQYLSSELIRQAMSASRYVWGDPPEDGMVTLVAADKVRHKRDPGRCYIKAGFKYFGLAKNGLLIFKIDASEMPQVYAPIGATMPMLEATA